jgi:segregation and condensation protein B
VTPPCRNVMSLRAKIEAVVYAAEEPVTLAQLAAVFAPEVRDLWDAEQREASAASDEVKDESAHADLLAEESVADPVVDTALNGAAEHDASEVAEEVASSDPNAEEAAAKRAARNEERAIREHLRKLLDELMAELQTSDRGVEIREIAGGYRMATKPEYHDAIRSFVKSLKPPMKLSLQALETLAVIAYKQPVTGPEISEIRGVESAGVLGSLLSRKLITTAGRKQVIGRPILYKTTKEFLLRFGLKDLNELPSIEEFEKMATELAEGDLEPVAEGGFSTSEAEQSLNDEEGEDAAEEPVVDPELQEQKAGEA